MVAEYTEQMDVYDPTRAMRLVSDFTAEHLSKWYVRRNRRRFWKGEMSEDKLAAYQTLYECMAGVLKLMAPLAPFISEHLYRALNTTTGREENESVHLAMIPEVDREAIDLDLERRMERAQQVVALARMLREKSKLKVRQPLRRILIPVARPGVQSDFEAVADIIRDELNVKSIEYISGDEDSDIVRMKAKANFKIIGPKYGKLAKQVAAAIAGLSSSQIGELQRSGTLTITTGSDSFALFPEDIEVIHEDIEGWLVASDGGVTVALDTELDEELRNEGLAREFVNRVQNLRKDAGLEVTDRIRLNFSSEANLKTALESQRDYIMVETLALELQAVDNGREMLDIDINGIPCRIALERIAVEN
jgi:isoleucyl-tRNA synthetase